MRAARLAEALSGVPVDQLCAQRPDHGMVCLKKSRIFTTKARPRGGAQRRRSRLNGYFLRGAIRSAIPDLAIPAKMVNRTYSTLFLLLAGSILLSLLYCPPVDIPLDDKEVFRYGGWVLSKGGVPYRDFFDHKPPLIYFLNFAGLLLGFLGPLDH